MADPQDINKDSSSNDDFGDDLDEMLNDTELNIEEQDDLIDDEDAIDRLLVDDGEVAGAEDNSNEIDEFSDDEKDEFSVDDLIDSETDRESKEGAETVEQIRSEKTLDDGLEVDNKKDPEDDFLLADFDISSDDEEAVPAVVAPELESQVIVETASATVPDNTAIDALNVQVTELRSENDNFKLQIAELVALNSRVDPNVEEIETLQKGQRKLSKAIKENESKVPVVTFIALAVAILALLIGGGLGAIGFGADSNVTELSELVVTLEEEIETLAAKDSSADIKKLDDKTELLVTKDQQINKQLESMNSRMQSNPLKPVVDDLVVQNNHAQEAIETLLAKVETLEKRKPIAIAKPKPKKPKKVVVKITWVVNLVSFKQEWYARRKATEFQKKGIPAEMIPVKVKGEKWFRLTVKGFKSKYEAAAYAVKVKKSLNLNAVWVAKA